MANRQRAPVSYQPFRTQPVLADGLLAVARPGGEVFERASSALFRIAAQQGEIADRQAARAGKLAGERAALAAGPGASVAGSGAGKARGGSFAPAVNAAIDQAATKYGVDAATLRTIAQIESGGNPRAKNPSSSAGGLFQFIDSTAKQYGLADRFDPVQAADAGARLMRDNRNTLARALGRQPTAGELYLAHQQGAGGAIRLLRNPDASAASVVGADAVRLNGGKPGMTAGQFAQLWTSRAGGGYVLPSDPGQLGVTVSGGRFRPSGSDTIYGRAYDEAGTKTYLQQVDTEMRSTIQQTYELYRDDPAALEKGLGVLKGVLMKDHVFPEIQADFSTSFDSMAQRYMGAARENLAKRIKAQDRADYYERTNQLETDQQKLLADFDPKSPGAAEALASAQAAIDAHYDSAVDRGILDADDAAKAKIASRRNTALAFYGKQAAALDADGVKTLRSEMEADFADGGIAGLDGEGWATLDRNLQKLEKDKRSGAERAENDLRKQGDKMAQQMLHGSDVNQAELSKLMLDAGTTPGGKEVMQETLAKISAGRAIRDFSLPDAVKHVAGLRKQYGDQPIAAQARTLAFAEQMLAEKRDAIRTDSVTYAEQNGMVPATPLLTDAETPQDMATIMSARAEGAEKAASELGVAPRYLKAGEAKAISAMVKADPAQGAAMAGAIVAGAGRAAPQVMAEFGDDATMIAQAGAIVAFGGSTKAAEDVIAGYGKGPDGKKLTGLKPDAARNEFASVAGDALALAAKDSNRIAAAAASIARTRISEQGIDPASDDAAGVYAQAVQEAAGAVFDRGVQYGGFATVGAGVFSNGEKVLIPSDIRADHFEDVLGALTDDDLKKLPHQPKAGRATFGLFGDTVKPRGLAATLQNAVPVAVAGGFAFAAGDPGSADPQWIMGDDGKPFVLDIMALRDRLAPRVPGAFR